MKTIAQIAAELQGYDPQALKAADVIVPEKGKPAPTQSGPAAATALRRRMTGISSPICTQDAPSSVRQSKTSGASSAASSPDTTR